MKKNDSKQKELKTEAKTSAKTDEKAIEILERIAEEGAPTETKEKNKRSSNLLSPKTRFFVREAYKTLRTNVTFALTDGVNSKVIMITSAVQGEGKSTTALNLAISYAEMDKRVLIIDCDLRRPKLARLLALKSNVGLSELLLDLSLEHKAIQPSGIENLDVVLSGAVPPNPSELLATEQMHNFLNDMRKEYDLIVIDSPPITMVTDALVLAPVIDGTLVIVRAAHTDRGAVAFAVEQLAHAKAKVLGFIFNCVTLDKTSYSYSRSKYKNYKRYYGHYGYGRGGYGYGSYGGYGGYSSYGGYGYGYGYGRPQEQHRPPQPEQKEPTR